MTDEELGYATALELAERMRKRALSPVELMKAVLRRIERLEPELNAFATLVAEPALAAAKEAEARFLTEEAPPPLAGIPVTIKDLTITKGIKTERGSFTQRGVVPAEDAPFVSRLKDAGAIVLGKTTTSEFGWKGVSQSPLTGITHNPWRKGFNAGASSAGAAVAAAAGYGPLHQGSDGAGSIRMPAHFCGVFGLKPTYGRVPNYPVGTGDYTAHIGPLTRTVADAALMLAVMAGPHPLDHSSAEAWPAPYAARLGKGIRGARIAFSPDLGHARVDAEVAGRVAEAVKVFASELGAHVEAVKPAWGPLGPELIRLHWPAHMTSFARYLAQWGTKMDPGLVACIRDGQKLTMAGYQEARERKYAYCAAVGRFFEDWDFLLTPSVSVAAFPAERLMPADWPEHPWDWLSWAEFSYPFNFTGNPAASIPCGFTPDGRPVGLQIVGRRFDDEGVLRAAAAFETARPWAGQRPPL
ncbi:MAG TPA: amidase family protein [Acetobacteraceae bacterium]|nr:amidase family protein [Acetobacteraceae bacterium]